MIFYPNPDAPEAQYFAHEQKLMHNLCASKPFHAQNIGFFVRVDSFMHNDCAYPWAYAQKTSNSKQHLFANTTLLFLLLRIFLQFSPSEIKNSIASVMYRKRPFPIQDNLNLYRKVAFPIHN
jgi:hypothetical protein